MQAHVEGIPKQWCCVVALLPRTHQGVNATNGWPKMEFHPFYGFANFKPDAAPPCLCMGPAVHANGVLFPLEAWLP